jgi:hypothetical protein
MFRRPLRRAVALSLGAVLLVAGTASADSVTADSVVPIVDRSHFLGDVAPGGTVSADVTFVVTCIGLQHIDPGQSVVLTGNGGIEPSDGKIVSASTATLDALDTLNTPWAPDGQGCPDPVPSYAGGAVSHVVLRAPTGTGTHKFTVSYSRSLSPSGNNDANAFGRTATSLDFTVRVVANTPPILTVTSVPASPVEGDTSGGWTGAWSVSATDAEDDPDPIPTCTPSVGSVLPVGVTTTVTCTAVDTAGASDSETFDVTVQDTTGPTLHDVPTDLKVTTSDPTGRTVDFATPTASDIVDGSLNVACVPASGDHFDVDTTLVTCTATDGSGNPTSGTFSVTVVYEPPPPPPPTHAASAVWLEPVAGPGATFEANRGRTIPVKVRLFVDDQERSSGDATLRLTSCGGGGAVDLPLTWSGGRWNVSLDTGTYPASCYTVEAWIGDLKAGSFTLELRGDSATKASAKRTAVKERSIAPTIKSKPTRTR